MLNALSGWLAGFNGDFAFENIGDDYISHNVSPSTIFAALRKQ
jgi:dolichyl-phosphate-mannose--protein O-mannosyl transferase